MSNGEKDRARTELEHELKLVSSLSAGGSGCPAFVLNKALTLAALGQWSGVFELARSPIHSHPPNVEIDRLEQGLAELTARRIGWLPSMVKSAWLIPEDLPTEAWVDRVVAAVQADASTFELDRTRTPAIARTMMMQRCATTLIQLRRAGNLDDEHRIVDQSLALARRLERSYPDQAAAYMLLSDGYVQRAKIAYHVNGEPVIGWERQALDAAIHAATLDPEDDQAHVLVKERRSRLNKLESK